MFFQDRIYRVIDVRTIDEVAERLAGSTWPLCTAFQCGDLLLVNDSTSENGAQEYAVVRNGRVVDSVTVSWCEIGDLVRILGELSLGAGGDCGAAPIRLDHPQGSCRFCA